MSRWFEAYVRHGGRVHRDQLPPRLLRALRRKAEKQLAREAFRRRVAGWWWVRWAFWAICLGAGAAAALRWVMGWG